jgi:mRNA interferase RelE/StbE
VGKYKITYRSEVLHDDLPRIDTVWQRAIQHAIEEKLTERPELYGKPLHKELKGFWKLRVGDYRVVFQLEGAMVRVIAILHRKSDYRGVEKRL